jgi:hypothetical protein
MVPGGIVLLGSLRLHSSWRWPIVGLNRGMGGFRAFKGFHYLAIRPIREPILFEQYLVSRVDKREEIK